MAKKLPLAVLISGTGRTLKNLIDKVEEGKLDVDIRLVVSSSDRAKGLQFAEQNNIPIAIVKSSEFQTKQEFSDAVFAACRAAKVEYVAMAGYLKLLAIPDDFTNKVLNIHPSLIPSFCGENYYGRRVHDAALRRGVKVSGATVHFVDNEYDHGPILLQKTVPVYDADTVDTLSDRVLREAEFVAYPEALQLLAQDRVEFVEERDSFRVRVRPAKPQRKAAADDKF
ncbi:MAG: phosphoribosylglycinamide formyltransferase [Thermoguttaceae bacterium]|nr:phosphoribosylglycinamide formyltransferase [Thermoguttaceae bacterium]MBQ9800351.1 phosphoribosylglycinamide formyltransferase [Thermoguttaceae bacterium]